MRPVTKNIEYADDTNLIALYSQIEEKTNYADNFIGRRKIRANYEEDFTYDDGEEGTFTIKQNTTIDNSIEPARMIIAGNRPVITYQCEIPLFQELYDAIDNGYRISRISGNIQNGFLSGSITIGNEELL